jgi:chemotaxis methyl-accepting protein methylase
MSEGAARVAAVRRALESSHGLALGGLSDEQIALAVKAAGGLEGRAAPDDPALLERVVDRLPIDESWLFRDERLWGWLRDAVLPGVLERSMGEIRAARALSLGCSGGQEAFSVAIVAQALLEAMGIPGSAASSYFEVRGVDSSPARVAQARAGQLSAWSVQRCGAEWLRGRVSPEDAASGRWRVDGSVLSMCRFDVANIVELAARGPGALSGFDLVLCRNVLIYFRAEAGAKLVAALATALDPGAVLVLSPPEAHLLQGVAALEPLAFLGAARAQAPAAAAARRPARGRRRPPSTRGPTWGWPSTPGGTAGAAAAGPALPAAAAARAETPAPVRAAIAARHAEGALAHAAAGRAHEAVREARAACLQDPRHLFSRMVLGRELIAVDAARGREVLRDVLRETDAMPQDAEVPSAPGLSVGQLASAVRLILAREGG